MDNDEVVTFVKKHLDDGLSPTEAAEKLTAHAIDEGSTDNCSVVIIKFVHPPVQAAAAVLFRPDEKQENEGDDEDDEQGFGLFDG
jgi:serine/threonine protein phosphatase PrpC